MHADDMEEIDEASAGDVVAIFGVECASMDSFADPTGPNLALTSMFVPQPVMSLAVAPATSAMSAGFSKALAKFTKEDPTLRVHVDAETKQTIVSGMGELHLEVYVERIKREYGVELKVGQPKVNYRETVRARVEFNHLHKKQSGGSGQYGRVVGWLEPLEADDDDDDAAGGASADDDDDGEAALSRFEFVNNVIGTNIPSEYIPSCEKGARAACKKGNLIGAPLQGVRVVLEDGQSHAVDSSDLAFSLAMQGAVRDAVTRARPVVLEPVMAAEVIAPVDEPA